MKPRILFIINSLGGGGAERVITMILGHSEHKRERFDIRLALLDREPAAYPVPVWVEVHQLDCSFSLVRSVAQLRALTKVLDPDCTLSFLTRANVANCLTMPRRSKPSIISERANTDMQLGSGLRGGLSKIVVRHTYPRASRVIAVARGVGERLSRKYGVARSKIEVVHNPVDVEAIGRRASEDGPHIPDESFVFAMGRLVEIKNFKLLLRAFAQSGIPGKLMIAGEGPQRPSLLALARDLGIADRFLLPGFLENPYPALSRASTFVLSSNAEGFPNALVEALSLGVPCVATNCAEGPAEILAGVDRKEISGLVHCPAGILVPVNDAVALASALQELRDPKLRAKLSAAGRARARTFSVESAVERYWDIIEQELQRQSTAG